MNILAIGTHFEKTETAICEWCRASFLRAPNHIPLQRFCSEKCQKQYNYEKEAKKWRTTFSSQQERKEAYMKRCQRCGKDFVAMHHNQKYCSVGCGAEYRERFRISRNEIYKIRDGLGACEICGFDDVIIAHHILSMDHFATPQEWNDGSNIAVLCPNHHEMYHHKIIDIRRNGDGKLEMTPL